MSIDHVIFDLDGTLVDSVDAHAEAWHRAFRHFGVDVPVQNVRQQIGKGGDQLLPVFLSAAQIESFGDALEEHRGDLFRREYLAHVKPFPMVRELFARLVADGRRVALGSSSNARDLDYLVDRLGIGTFLDAKTNADDVAQSKPRPDVFVEALRRLGNPPKAQVVVIGDTPWDAIAAARAGLQTIGLRAGGVPEDDLRAAGCIAVYNDVAELLERYESWTSPVR